MGKLKQLKKEIIEKFGLEKWAEEEMISKLIKLSMHVCKLLKIEMVPILFEDIGIEDSRLYLNDPYIAISEKYIDDYIECAKCVCHEFRHLYQIAYVKTNCDSKALIMKKELLNIKSFDFKEDGSVASYMMQEIEIDAFAFTKWYMDKFLNIDVIHKIELYEEIIKEYIEKNY